MRGWTPITVNPAGSAAAADPTAAAALATAAAEAEAEAAAAAALPMATVRIGEQFPMPETAAEREHQMREYLNQCATCILRRRR